MESLFDSDAFQRSLFFPRTDVSPCPVGARDLTLSVAPGVALHARWHASASSRATVLLFHGNGEVVADYDHTAERYHDDVRADLVVVDFRGYGGSGGVPTLRNCISDAVAVIDPVRAALGSGRRSPLVTLGRSLGGACAAELAGIVPPIVDAIVLESAGADPLSLLARRGMQARAPLSDAETRAFDPRPKLARCRLPTLVLHGASDEIISADEARTNFAALASPRKRLVLVEGRGHNDVLADDAYWQALSEFVASL